MTTCGSANSFYSWRTSRGCAVLRRKWLWTLRRSGSINARDDAVDLKTLARLPAARFHCAGAFGRTATPGAGRADQRARSAPSHRRSRFDRVASRKPHCTDRFAYTSRDREDRLSRDHSFRGTLLTADALNEKQEGLTFRLSAAGSDDAVRSAIIAIRGVLDVAVDADAEPATSVYLIKAEPRPSLAADVVAALVGPASVFPV